MSSQCGHLGIPRGELRVGRNPALLLGAPEDALAVGVPAIVELAGVLVGPLLEDVVGRVEAAGGPVHEERLVGSNAWWRCSQEIASSARSSLRW
jgi:hypothetical protein